MRNRLPIKDLYDNLYKGCDGDPAIVADTIHIHPQQNQWSCGPMALRHALIGYGLDVDARRLAKLAGTTRAGTSEPALKKAVTKLRLSLRLKFNRKRSAASAKRLLKSHLSSGIPVILCVDTWSHWIAVLHRSRRGYLIIDSSRPGPVIQLTSWKKLSKRMSLKYSNGCRRIFNGDKRPIYDVGAIVTKWACTKKQS